MRWRRRAEEQSHEDAAAGQIAELVASRRIIVDACEVERRRLERGLHDGKQQYLVAAAMKLGEAALSPSVEADPALAALIDQLAKKDEQIAKLMETVADSTKAVQGAQALHHETAQTLALESTEQKQSRWQRLKRAWMGI